MNKEQLTELYINQGLSTHQIADLAGVTQISVWRKLKKFEIPARTYKENKMPVAKGSRLSSDHKSAISKSRILGVARTTDERAIAQKTWRRSAPGYDALHMWVRRKLGQPTTCSHCKQTNLIGTNIHWANVSGEYKREVGDWTRLCVTCHKAYDKWQSLYNKNITEEIKE